MADEQQQGVLRNVLGYIDSPFRLIVVLLLGLLAYSAYFIHNRFDVLFEAWQKQNAKPSLNEMRFDFVAQELFRELGADTIVFFALDPTSNKRMSLRAYTKDMIRDRSVEDLELGLFSGNAQNNKDVLDMIAGAIPCHPQDAPQSIIGLWYSKKGVTFTCRVFVPPEIQLFIGQITVGWKTEPENLVYVRSALNVAARTLAVGNNPQ